MRALYALKEAGTQAAREELLCVWALRCIRGASAGVGQQLPYSEGGSQQAHPVVTQPMKSDDVTEVVVLDDSEDVVRMSTKFLTFPHISWRSPQP